MSTQTERHVAAHAEPDFDVDDPRLSRFDLVREGARRDGVEIVHFAPRFPVPGTKAERRIERTIALLFLITGLAATAFVVIFTVFDVGYKPGANANKLFTPLLGFTLGVALLCVGLAIIIWAKKLLPEEISVEARHGGSSAHDDRKIAVAAMTSMVVDEIGITRRPLLLKGAIALGLLPVGALAVVPLVGALLKDPHRDGLLFHTGWDPVNNNGKLVPLVRDDGTKIRPEEVSTGGQMTAFPGIFKNGEFVGASNDYADSPILLIHLREKDADEANKNLHHVAVNDGAMYNDFVAYSKICTHAGCPASLYEQQTNRLLCPCHQSQFQITDNARPIFGPATRRLPMLPIRVDDDGFLVATSDFKVPIGPGFWERP